MVSFSVINEMSVDLWPSRLKWKLFGDILKIFGFHNLLIWVCLASLSNSHKVKQEIAKLGIKLDFMSFYQDFQKNRLCIVFSNIKFVIFIW